MTQKELEYLLEGYFQGTLSPEDEDMLMHIYMNMPTDEQLGSFDMYYKRHAKLTDFSEEQKLKIWKNITRERSLKKPYFKSFNYLKYAAAMLLLSLCTALIYSLWFRNISSDHYPQHVVTDSIYLRKYKGLTLTMIAPNGSSRVMTAQDWIIYDISIDGNILILGPSIKDESVRENRICIKTEKGQTQQIKLSDGTKVWLNSNSQLIIPSQYAIEYRATALFGEAYFEVASKKDHPFEVHTVHNTTRVLGTHFNINAKPLLVEKTTLIEGAVQVYNNKDRILLKPGEQAVGNDNLIKSTIDIARVMDWKNGDFYFDNIPIEQLMEIIEEWYDVKYIDYKHKSKDRFSGIFKRTNSLEELLKNLEMVSSLRFEIKNGGVNVLNK